MTRPTFTADGNQAYRKADEQLGVSPPPHRVTPLAWLRNGSMPSLWFLARLQLALAVLTFLVETVAHVVAAIATLNVSKELGTVIVQALGIFTWSTPCAVLMSGSAITSYLAGKQDRERRADLEASGPKPAPSPE